MAVFSTCQCYGYNFGITISKLTESIQKFHFMQEKNILERIIKIQHFP